MKEEELAKINQLCDEFNTVFEKVSATFDMLHQFQKNKDEISEASVSGSAWIMDDTIDSLQALKGKLFILNKELRD